MPPSPQSQLANAASAYAGRLAEKLGKEEEDKKAREESQEAGGEGPTPEQVDEGLGEEEEEEARWAEGRSKLSMLEILAWKDTASSRSSSEAPTEKKRNGGGSTAGSEGKRKPGNGLQQMFLDFGQKNFSSRSCLECGMVWCPGLPEEESLHARRHKRYTHGVEFRGWKGERATRTFPDGSRIVCVRQGDPDAHWEKVSEVEEIVQAELGSGGCQAAPRKQVHLYVSTEKRVVGFLSAQAVRRASRLLSRLDSTGEEVLELASEEEGVACGISEVWVLKAARGKGVARRLLETLLETFAPPGLLVRSQVAFSQPTPAGRALATKFFETQSFLVYRTTD